LTTLIPKFYTTINKELYMNRSETIAKISAALVKAQGEMGSATKDSKNPFFKSSYADLNAIREATIPVLNKNLITVLQPTTVFEGKAYVETTLLHESGEFLTSLTEIIAPKQNDPQAHGSGVSYARRYGLQSFLCVGAEDDDGEKAMGRNTKNVPTSASTVVKTNTVNGSPVGITAAGTAVETQSSTAPKKGFGVKKDNPTPVANATATGSEDGWN
jgi:hypothetical protein